VYPYGEGRVVGRTRVADHHRSHVRTRVLGYQLDELERSELTQESFARQRGIAVTTLRTWIVP
jgi:DNA-binding transcriptional regulator YiaG